MLLSSLLLLFISIPFFKTMKKINNFASKASSSINSPLPTSLAGKVKTRGTQDNLLAITFLTFSFNPGECKKAAKILNSFVGKFIRQKMDDEKEILIL